MMPLIQDFLDKLRFNENGLIPAIAQDWLDGTVLMMAWMNQESIIKTLQTKEVYYWSRSRHQLWKKGETSGHIQKLKEIRYDCDSDTILLTIKQIGSIACHTGARSCFFQEGLESSSGLSIEHPPSDICSEVFKVIKDRRLNPKDESYTNSLLKDGDNKILKKIGEEAVEFVMACKDKDKISIANEAADLIFHLQVALAHQEVDWRDLLEVLAERRS